MLFNHLQSWDVALSGRRFMEIYSNVVWNMCLMLCVRLLIFVRSCEGLSIRDLNFLITEFHALFFVCWLRDVYSRLLTCWILFNFLKDILTYTYFLTLSVFTFFRYFLVNLPTNLCQFIFIKGAFILFLYTFL
jgi:hypothetical protein